MARKRETQNLINSIDKTIAKIEKLIDEKPKKLVEDIDEEAKSIIARWYATYPSPIYYRRNGGLYHAYKIIQDGTYVEIDYDPSYMSDFSYNQDKAIVFNNAFQLGYHGGCLGAEVESNVPHWRTMFLHYTHWSYPAKKSFSPYKSIERAAKKLMKEYDASWDGDLDQIMNPLRRSFRAYLRR